jgi:hypothetical protein
MTSTTLINLEGVIDLNAMFSLNYNFDYLKCIIDALINANKNTNLKLKELEQADKEKTEKINE